MKGKKLIYIVSEVDKSLHFEWITPFLKAEFQLSFILIGKRDSYLEQFLKSEMVEVLSIACFRKSDLIKVWFKIFWKLLKSKPDIVHTHLWTANLTGLTAAWLARVNKRIYTRHHASIHYRKYPSGLKWDRLNNKLATHIIAVSKNVEHLLIYFDKAEKSKVRLIYHGFRFSYFRGVDRQRKSHFYHKHKINPDHHPVIGVISRHSEWKGVQYIIPAFINLRVSFPSAHLILANAHGDYADAIDLLLAELPASSFTKIVFENDLATLYQLFDIFVHVPVDEDSEAFGQVYIEPLIIGLPCVFTLSGVAREFAMHLENAMVVDFNDSGQIYASIMKLLDDPALVRALSENGKKAVANFTIERYLDCLKNLYVE